MRDTVHGYELRAGRPYGPADWVAALGRALADDEACPTLFRYPGPCGIQAIVGRDGKPPEGFTALGPPDRLVAWLSDATAHSGATGTALFGTVALLDPLGLGPALVIAPPFTHPTGLGGQRANVYVVENAPIGEGAAIVWVPPSKILAPIPWDDVATVEDANDALGAHLDEERREVSRRLTDYLAELDALKAAGAVGPGRPWCEVPEDQRRALLDRHGIARRFVGTAIAG